MSEPNVDPQTGEVTDDGQDGTEFDDSQPQRTEIQEIVETLKQASMDPRLWKRLPNSDQSPYIPWGTVAGLLDRHASEWSHTTTRADIKNGLAIMTVAIEVVGVARESTAAEALKGVVKNGPKAGEEYDIDAIEKAERRALSRAAKLFGIGRRIPKEFQRNRN